MATEVISYINFKDNAREAAEFYHSVFGGKLEVMTFADFESEEMPVGDEDKDKVMHAFLRGESGVELMLSDTPSYMEYHDGARITIAINTDDETEGRELWDKLTEGGKVTMPLEKSMWNSTFGMFSDKFGVCWMLDIGEIQE